MPKPAATAAAAAGKPPTYGSYLEKPSARSEDETSQPSTSTTNTSGKPTKQQSKVAPKSPALGTAMSDALEMQRKEHALQMQYLEEKIRFQREEHDERMDLFRLQRNLLTNSNKQMAQPTEQEATNNTAEYNLFSIYSQLN